MHCSVSCCSQLVMVCFYSELCNSNDDTGGIVCLNVLRDRTIHTKQTIRRKGLHESFPAFSFWKAMSGVRTSSPFLFAIGKPALVIE